MESIWVNFKSKSDYNLVFSLLQKMKLDYKVIQENDRLKLLIDDFFNSLPKNEPDISMDEVMNEIKIVRKKKHESKI